MGEDAPRRLEACGREEGAPPPVDLAVERRNGDFVRGQILLGRVEACHDLSDGGLLVGLVKVLAISQFGADIEKIPVWGLLLVILVIKPTGLFGGSK